MSTTSEDTAVEAEVIPQAVPQPVHYVDGMTPLYIFEGLTDVTRAFDDIRKQGVTFFYVLAEEERIKTTTNATTKVTTVTGMGYAPRLYKVVTNLVGHAVAQVDELKTTSGLTAVQQLAWYDLPKMPWAMVEKLDTFFRTVHKDLGTEAVVMFTFDPSFLELEDEDKRAEGWGVLVPKQKNTAASCDYDPQSIIDDKPDEVYIVGTAHSHPEMTAFCSGTDKADQANFDGLHITFGWPARSPSTEFHLELQMAGQAYRFQPEDIFSGMPEPVADETVKGWMKSVEKKTATVYSAPAAGGATTYRAGGGVSYSYPGMPKDTWDQVDPRRITLIVKLTPEEESRTTCPCCHATMSEHALKSSMRCTSCTAFIISAETTIEQLIQRREDLKFHSDALDVEKAPKDIWVGVRTTTPVGGTSWTFDQLAAKAAPLTATKIDPPETPPSFSRGGSLTATDVLAEGDGVVRRPVVRSWSPKERVCHPELDLSTPCPCGETNMILWDETDELIALADLEPYNAESRCSTCALAFTPWCDPLTEWMRDFMGIASSVASSTVIEGCEDYQAGDNSGLTTHP